MYIRRFTYKKEDVDCKLCTEYRGRKKCPHKICPYITERIEAGAVTYQEAVNAMVHPGCQLIRRLPKLMQTYSDSFWVDDRHKSRMEFFNTRMGYSPSRNTPAYYAAMYLLTANETVYWRMANCFCSFGLFSENTQLHFTTRAKNSFAIFGGLVYNNSNILKSIGDKIWISAIEKN